MQEHLIELCVGETLHVGSYAVTLVEVDGGELCLKIEGYDDEEDVLAQDSEVLQTS